MINSKSIKLIGIAVLFIVISLGILAGVNFVNPQAQDDRAAEKYFDDLKAQYENDTYGGNTPEETIALFIEALEVEDVELASKYFLPDNKEEQKSYLIRAQENTGDFSIFIQDAERLRLSRKEEDRAFYTIADENNVVEVQVVLKKNQNNVWKITEL